MGLAFMFFIAGDGNAEMMQRETCSEDTGAQKMQNCLMQVIVNSSWITIPQVWFLHH